MQVEKIPRNQNIKENKEKIVVKYLHFNENYRIYLMFPNKNAKFDRVIFEKKTICVYN